MHVRWLVLVIVASLSGCSLVLRLEIARLEERVSTLDETRRVDALLTAYRSELDRHCAIGVLAEATCEEHRQHLLDLMLAGDEADRATVAERLAAAIDRLHPAARGGLGRILGHIRRGRRR